MQQDAESHVLYLFGAGASVNAIPVVDGIPDDMRKVASELEKWHKEHQILDLEEYVTAIFEALDELADTVKNSGNELTVDGYI